MSEVEDKPAGARKPRADAQRNRLRLLEAAKAAFTAGGADVTMDEIARRAGVGIGTLYRHFPTRDAVLEAVYRHEVEQLAAAASDLADTLPPLEALRAWLRLSIDYMATKKVVMPALQSLVGDTTELVNATGTSVKAANGMLFDRAIASGDIGAALDPLDPLRAIFGLANASPDADWAPSARRLIDILIAGLKAGSKA